MYQNRNFLEKTTNEQKKFFSILNFGMKFFGILHKHPFITLFGVLIANY